MAGFAYSDQDTVVRTKEGLLRGFKNDGIYQFRGIKYADAKRFEVPVRCTPWEGIREATVYGYCCTGAEQPKKAPVGELSMGHRYWPESEHCQYLNIWTGNLDVQSHKPVMVWIHGGGYSEGSSIDFEIFDGFNTAKIQDVVFVSLNHRLNVFGHLDVSDFGKKYQNSVNAGLEDIVVALEWIKDNIEAFGGDPENVTIFGHSGGGGKVSALMQVPSAEGLFQRAVIMSGIIPDDNVLVKTEVPAKEIVLEIMKELGLKEDEFEKFLRCPEIPLVRAVRRACRNIVKRGGVIGWGPKKNGWYLGDIGTNEVCEFSKKIPTMVGNAITEFLVPDNLKNKKNMTAEEKESYIQSIYGKEKGNGLLERFRKAYPEVNEVYAAQYDTFFRKDTLRYLKVKSQSSSAPVFSYIMALESDFNGGTISSHGSELPYVFHNTDLVPAIETDGGKTTKCLEKQFSDAFAAFARNGNPNIDSLPEWPACKEGHISNMVFDRECHVYTDHEQELLDYVLQLNPPMKIDFYGENEEKELWPY